MKYRSYLVEFVNVLTGEPVKEERPFKAVQFPYTSLQCIDKDCELVWVPYILAQQTIDSWNRNSLTTTKYSLQTI